jgi:hypothetical protein
MGHRRLGGWAIGLPAAAQVAARSHADRRPAAPTRISGTRAGKQSVGFPTLFNVILCVARSTGCSQLLKIKPSFSVLLQESDSIFLIIG